MWDSCSGERCVAAREGDCSLFVKTDIMPKKSRLGAHALANAIAQPDELLMAAGFEASHDVMDVLTHDGVERLDQFEAFPG